MSNNTDQPDKSFEPTENENTEDITGMDILKEIDMDKINTLKKKRGRPQKAKTIEKINNEEVIMNNDEDEIILSLSITLDDLNIMNNSITEYSENKTMSHTNTNTHTKTKKQNAKKNEETIDNDSTNINNEFEEFDDDIQNDEKEKNKTMSFSNMKIKQLCAIIIKQSKELKQLKKHIKDITPMFCSEVKEYPSNIFVNSENGETIIPKETNICCWWCTYGFNTMPIYLPEKYVNGKYYVFGNFCSFNCSAAYNCSICDSRILERYTMLKQIYYLIFKNIIQSVKDIDINLAPSNKKLIKFGGQMTIEDYRRDSKILKKEYYEMLPPLGGLNIVCSDVTNSSNLDNIDLYNILMNDK